MILAIEGRKDNTFRINGVVFEVKENTIYRDGEQCDMSDMMRASSGKKYIEMMINGEFISVELMSKEDIAFLEAIANNHVDIPSSLTPRQFRLGIYNDGMYDNVQAMVKQSQEYEIYYEYSLEFDRHNPLLIQMAYAMGMSDTDIDAKFVEWSAL